MKKLLLTFILAITLASASFANKDTIIVVSTTSVYDGSWNPITSLTVNAGDTIYVENQSGVTANFTCNTTTFSSICGSICSFMYKTLPTDAPNFILKAFVPLNSTTYNLITVYVNNTATDITKQNNLVSYNLFPNPANNVFSISGLKTANISVYNQLGSIVKQQVYKDEDIKLNIADLPKGIYMVEVWADGKRSVSKLVKE